MGKLWGNKVEEIANLKAEKEEIREELEQTRLELETLKTEIRADRISKASALHQVSAVSTEYSKLLETCTIQEHIIAGLADIKSNQEQEIQSLKTNLSSLQTQLESCSTALKNSQKLEHDLREEIKRGENLRSSLEKENIRLEEELANKIHDVQTLIKAKEHCERHISILVKDKDRALKKTDPKPESCSKIFETIVENKVTSWGQVENQRLKALLDEEKKENESKTSKIEKLEKENWNLLNRLRNKK